MNLEQKSAEYDGLLFDCFWELRLFFVPRSRSDEKTDFFSILCILNHSFQYDRTVTVCIEKHGHIAREWHGT